MKSSPEEEILKGVWNGLLLRDSLERLKTDEGISVFGEEAKEQTTAELEVQDFSPQIRAQAAEMQAVYVQFFCLENAVRELISQRLSERHGVGWWELKVPVKVREGVEKLRTKEEKNKYLATRSPTAIGYTFFGNLAQIIIANWEDFSDLFPDQAWINSRFNDLEMCRNIIMHTNVLPSVEIARIDSLVRDWLSQVG
jgi:hypothetical protein